MIGIFGRKLIYLRKSRPLISVDFAVGQIRGRSSLREGKIEENKKKLAGIEDEEKDSLDEVLKLHNDADQAAKGLSQPSYGVFNMTENDDIDTLVRSYTTPALARALREREVTLQRAASLMKKLNTVYENTSTTNFTSANSHLELQNEIQYLERSLTRKSYEFSKNLKTYTFDDIVSKLEKK